MVNAFSGATRHQTVPFEQNHNTLKARGTLVTSHSHSVIMSLAKKKEEERRKKEEGKRKKEEGRRKKEEGRRKKEEGRRKKEEGKNDSITVSITGGVFDVAFGDYSRDFNSRVLPCLGGGQIGRPDSPTPRAADFESEGAFGPDRDFNADIVPIWVGKAGNV